MTRCVLSWTMASGLDNEVQKEEEGMLTIMNEQFLKTLRTKDGSTNEQKQSNILQRLI